jgi:hypothetical protein
MSPRNRCENQYSSQQRSLRRIFELWDISLTALYLYLLFAAALETLAKQAQSSQVVLPVNMHQPNVTKLVIETIVQFSALRLSDQGDCG